MKDRNRHTCDFQLGGIVYNYTPGPNVPTPRNLSLCGSDSIYKIEFAQDCPSILMISLNKLTRNDFASMGKPQCCFKDGWAKSYALLLYPGLFLLPSSPSQVRKPDLSHVQRRKISLDVSLHEKSLGATTGFSC